MRVIAKVSAQRRGWTSQQFACHLAHMPATKRPAEAQLLADALESIDGLSQNAAAKAAGISGTRWRDIVRGHTTAGNVPVRAPAKTLARMAAVLGISPGDLREHDRPDAAEALEAMETRHLNLAPDAASAPEPSLDFVDVDDLTSEQIESLRAMANAWRQGWHVSWVITPTTADTSTRQLLDLPEVAAIRWSDGSVQSMSDAPESVPVAAKSGRKLRTTSSTPGEEPEAGGSDE